MSLLDIVQDAAVLCNLPAPSSVISSSDPNASLLLRLANQEGNELSRRHDWQTMTIDYTFTSVATEKQTQFPTGYDRLVPYPEVWNRSLGLPYNGPTSRRTWGTLKGLAVTSASPGWWRLTFSDDDPYGPTLEITPAPTAGETIAVPYVQKQWVSAADRLTLFDSWQSDTNFCDSFPERLITLGIVWRYKRAKGLDYAEDMSTYEREVERACSRDRGAGVLRPRNRNFSDLPGPSWIGTVTP